MRSGSVQNHISGPPYQHFIGFDIKLIAFGILVFGVFGFGILVFGVFTFGDLAFGILDFSFLAFGISDSVSWPVIKIFSFYKMQLENSISAGPVNVNSYSTTTNYTYTMKWCYQLSWINLRLLIPVRFSLRDFRNNFQLRLIKYTHKSNKRYIR